jgi:two-component system cell cycle response regulator
LRALPGLDPLTGLAHRGQADRWLAEESLKAAAQERPLACLMLDLDHFKPVNDTEGHLAGDRRLRETAETLLRELPPSARSARFGGDEFVILLPGATLGEATARAEILRQALRTRGIEASLGVACLKATESGEAMLGRADSALVRAKQRGRGRVEAET